MMFILSKANGRDGRDTYTDGKCSLVVKGGKGILVDHQRGAKKVKVETNGTTATITEEVSGWIGSGHEAVGWLKG